MQYSYSERQLVKALFCSNPENTGTIFQNHFVVACLLIVHHPMNQNACLPVNIKVKRHVLIKMPLHAEHNYSKSFYLMQFVVSHDPPSPPCIQAISLKVGRVAVSFPMITRDTPHPPVVSKASNVSRPMDLAFSCYHDDVLRTTNLAEFSCQWGHGEAL